MAIDPEALDTQDYSDRQIAEMPLHSVTAALGSEGLQRRFHLEIEQFTPEDLVQLEKAFHWAMDFHTKDSRYHEPATNHILRVATRIIHHYGVKDVDVITAALLHDIVEDHAAEIAEKPDATAEDGLAVISAEFNPDVSSLVGSLTNPEYEDDRDRLEQYQEHVTSILENDDPRVRIIKVSDFTDNAKGLIYMPTEGAVYRSRRYSVLVTPFEDAIMKPDTPLSNEARAHIIKDLEETRRRLALFTSNVS